MSVQLAIASIALDTASVSRQGFGTLLFVGKHNYFSDRIRAYTSTSSMVDDGIPTSAGIYAAAQSAFSQATAPKSIMIGRQETTSILSVGKVVASGDVFSVTIGANEAVQATYTITADGSSDEETIVDDIKSAIEADTDILDKITLAKVGTGSATTLTLTQKVSGTDWFTISSLQNLVETFVATSTEDAADTINAISDEDDSYYYFLAEDKSNAFIKAAAAEIESRTKVYRTSVNEVSGISASPSGTMTDLQELGYFRTQCFASQQAETTFPEVAATAEIAGKVTGSVTYANRKLAAVAPSQNSAGKALTLTQQTRVKAQSGDYFARVGSSESDPLITVVGKVAGGEWLDNIVGRDNMQVDLQADLTNLFINQTNSKVTFNNAGANQLRNVVSTVLQNYTASGTHNFIEEDFEIIIPDESEFNSADKGTRTFTQLTFKARLTNAIHMVELTGTLSL